MKKRSKAREAVEAYNRVGEATDPLGSYTGLFRFPAAGECHVASEVKTSFPPELNVAPETPVQDVDDL